MDFNKDETDEINIFVSLQINLGKHKIIDPLIKHGGNVDWIDNKGKTALRYAAESGKFEIKTSINYQMSIATKYTSLILFYENVSF